MSRVLLFVLGLLVFALPVSAQDDPVVTPSVETAPSPGDGATDAVVWLHPTNLDLSLILGSDDNVGIAVYEFDGSQRQVVEVGSVKYIDVRYNFPLGARRISLISAAMEDQPLVSLFTVDLDTRELEAIGSVETGVAVASACLYRSPLTETYYVFASDDDGYVEQYALDGVSGEISARLVREFSVGSETEGCVADDQLRHFFITEQGVGIWRYGAEPENGNTRYQVDLPEPRGHIRTELEGVALYTASGRDGYLIAPDQEDDTYLVYERDGDNAFVGRFSVGATEAIDRVNEGSGVGVVNLPLGAAFPDGLFITNDDVNSEPNDNNNFKLVSWAEVAAALDLVTDAAYDPRELGAVELAADVITVPATLETQPVASGVDAADDPAIWIHPTDTALSTLIGTDKTSGLVVYDLNGEILQTLDVGRLNNVDLRYNFDFGGESVALVGATNRTTSTLDLFVVDAETRALTPVGTFPSNVEEVYGVCLYASADGEHYAFVNSADTGDVEQYLITDAGDGGVNAEVVRTFTVGSQTEGCVVDDVLGALYIGEEAVGLWRYQAAPDADYSRVSVASTGEDGTLMADVEGVAIYFAADETGYLIVSSQGSSEFVLFERGGDNTYIGRFIVIEGQADAISGTDGLEVTNMPLGEQFPNGVFVAQDDLNIDPPSNQNFKLVDWAAIAERFDLVIDTTFDPRTIGAP